MTELSLKPKVRFAQDLYGAFLCQGVFPQSVASHTLYENADPFDLKEPSGTLDTREARYEAISDRAVRVSGSRFTADPCFSRSGGGRGSGWLAANVRHAERSKIRRQNSTTIAACSACGSGWPRATASIPGFMSTPVTPPPKSAAIEAEAELAKRRRESSPVRSSGW
jgi:hypothetical protein